MTRCITITKYINKHKDVFMYLLTIRFIRKEKDKDEFLLRVLISHSCKILFILHKMYKAQKFNEKGCSIPIVKWFTQSCTPFSFTFIFSNIEGL